MLTPLVRTKHSKKLLVNEIVSAFPAKYGRFVEASVTDAVVFTAQPRSSKRSVLNTTDPKLTVLLRALQTNPEQVLSQAQHLWEDLSREEYESIAAADLPADVDAAAAQILYLNHTSQPGTNKFDSKHKANQFSWNLLDAWAELLSGVKLLSDDPLTRFDQARPTDLVYLDTAAGVPVEMALHAAQQGPGYAAVVASAGLGAAPEQGIDGLQRVELTRSRPGMRAPDVLYLKVQ